MATMSVWSSFGNVATWAIALSAIDWIAESKPDIVALQETKSTDADFPHAAFQAAGSPARFGPGQAVDTLTIPLTPFSAEGRAYMHAKVIIDTLPTASPVLVDSHST